jgi:hypothetical protein
MPKHVKLATCSCTIPDRIALAAIAFVNDMCERHDVWSEQDWRLANKILREHGYEAMTEEQIDEWCRKRDAWFEELDGEPLQEMSSVLTDLLG